MQQQESKVVRQRKKVAAENYSVSMIVFYFWNLFNHIKVKSHNHMHFSFTSYMNPMFRSSLVFSMHSHCSSIILSLYYKIFLQFSAPQNCYKIFAKSCLSYPSKIIFLYSIYFLYLSPYFFSKFWQQSERNLSIILSFYKAY